MQKASIIITGDLLIGGESLAGGSRTLRAVDPATGQSLEPAFAVAGEAEVARAAELAAAAFDSYRETDPETRARFLETIAANIMELGDALIARAVAETGLPRGRIEGERARTVGQLRLFAEVVRRGDWLDARIDHAQPARAPLPRSDLRLRQIALGPVAVFGASNFPLAFSVAGGDTASALAAGCPVVVKGHPAHPGTGELVGRAVQDAVAACRLHPGVFALVLGAVETGSALVADPRIQAVGFTGSRRGGLALAAIAAARPHPIPIYAEMSSINPVFLLPAALAARSEALAQGFVQSLTLGAGQFCTNPGLLFALDGPDLQRFIGQVEGLLAAAVPAPMLTPGICQAYEAGVQALIDNPAAMLVARGGAADGPTRAPAALFVTDAAAFAADPHLSDEVFGASSLVVRCPDAGALALAAEALEGQLTATLQLDEADIPIARRLMPVLERKVGRILANGWPTGVEVCDAMVHGGPFPATSDSRSTSVGTLAIRRFLRPVCYQDLPAALLPAALQPGNPLHLPRLVEGRLETGRMASAIGKGAAE